MGRPTKLNPELADDICTRLAGGESLRAICRGDEYPALSTVLLWVVQDRDGFSAQYHGAREAAGYAHADEALELRHKVLTGEVEPNAVKVALDALKWGAERMAPKAHSQKQQLEHTGKDGGPIKAESKIDLSDLDSDEREQLRGILERRTGGPGEGSS